MAKTGHPNVNLRYNAPWRGITKTWSVQFNYSGALLSAPQALTFMQEVHNAVFAAYFSQHASAQFLSGYSHYDGTNSAALVEVEFDNAAASIAGGFNGVASYGAAYDPTTDLAVSGLEGCAVLLAPLGKNSTGKPFFMRKFLHGCPAMTGDTDGFTFAGGTAPAVQLGDGSLPGNRVLCTDKGAQGVWDASEYIGNHQLIRKYVKKTPQQLFADYLKEAKSVPILAD